MGDLLLLMPPVVLRDVPEYVSPLVIRLQPSEDLDRSWGKVAATTGNTLPQPLPETPSAFPSSSPCTHPVPRVPTLSPCQEFCALAGGDNPGHTHVKRVLGAILFPQPGGTLRQGSRSSPQPCPPTPTDQQLQLLTLDSPTGSPKSGINLSTPM